MDYSLDRHIYLTGKIHALQCSAKALEEARDNLVFVPQIFEHLRPFTCRHPTDNAGQGLEIIRAGQALRGCLQIICKIRFYVEDIVFHKGRSGQFGAVAVALPQQFGNLP